MQTLCRETFHLSENTLSKLRTCGFGFDQLSKSVRLNDLKHFGKTDADTTKLFTRVLLPETVYKAVQVTAH